MYGQVAGAGAAAGVPTLLAFTGMTGPGFATLLGVAMLLIVAGLGALRRSYRLRVTAGDGSMPGAATGR